MSVDDASGRMLARRLPGATVLQIVPSLADKPEARAAVNIAAALLRSGARAMIAGSPGMLVGQLQALGGEWVRFAGSTRNPIKLRSNGRALNNLIAGERVDIVHAYSGPIARSAYGATHDTGAWLITSYPGAPSARMGLASMYQGALARGRRVIAESEYAAELIMQRHGIPPERIAAIPPSIDTVRFDPAAVGGERMAALRHAWGIRAGWRIILVPGRLDSAHGQMTVIDAVRILVNGGMRGVAFVIVGEDGNDEQHARAVTERIDAQGIGGLVRRVRNCADMPAAYAIADLVIVPCSVPATFNRTAAEAQAMGRPVITSALGDLPETVLAPPRVADEDRTGWLINPSDPIELARAVAAALALDGAVRQAIGTRSRRRAETRFSPARVAGAILTIYGSLLEGER